MVDFSFYPWHPMSIVRKIMVDSHYLNRILTDLITNTVQAMPRGGKLTIKANKESGNILLKETQNKMFTPKSKGQGFGFLIVKLMTGSLGGKASFESQGGK
jgi:signal transduction histidine kinase